MTDDLCQESAAELAKLYAKRKASPVETMKAVLARADRLAPEINALCRVDAKESLAAARASEARWKKGKPLSPLDGVPVSIKELVRVKGWAPSMGSRLTDKTPATDEAPAVTRLREAGAIVFAQSTSSEYGHKGVTDSPLHGITRNPWNLERTPGGSSGGAGAAVARRARDRTWLSGRRGRRSCPGCAPSRHHRCRWRSAPGPRPPPRRRRPTSRPAYARGSTGCA